MPIAFNRVIYAISFRLILPFVIGDRFILSGDHLTFTIVLNQVFTPYVFC